MDSNHPRKGFADPCLPTWLPRLKAFGSFIYTPTALFGASATFSKATRPSYS
jgi:hypothetical protein